MKENWQKIGKQLLAVIMTATILISQCGFTTAPGGTSAEIQNEGSVGPAVWGTTYYVDAANGDDSKSGISESNAWRTFKNVNQKEFQPGDHILLKAGCVWNEQLFPKGNGSDGKPIVIDYYGTGAKPVINGMSTTPVVKTIPGTSSPNYTITGAVQLYNQEYWQIRDLEVTNSADPTNKESYKSDTSTDAERAGILAYADTQDRLYKSIVIKNCYVHDVQTRLQSVRSALKATGGIIILGHHLKPDGTLADGLDPATRKSTAGFEDVLIEGNYVQRVGLEGIRTKCNSDTSYSGNTFNKAMKNVTIRNNYLEDIAGDGIVLTEVGSGGLVENNVSKQACNVNFGTKNFAGIWSMYSDDALFQYNEAYGQLYGYNDDEAYDVDMSCQRNIYQYNYSHDNGGGFLLFMGGNDGSVVRYNISANDGGGNSGTGYTYDRQGIFHTATKGQLTHQIYNNTFYIGDGVSTSMFSEGGSKGNTSAMTTGSPFRNNVVLKEGSGDLKWVYTHNSDGTGVEGTLPNDPSSYIQNNCLYSTKTGDASLFLNSGFTADMLTAGNNIVSDPKLTDPSSAAEQKGDRLAEGGDVYNRCSTASLRQRLQGFQLGADSPCLGKGMKISGAPTEDIFGNTINGKSDIGAHQRSVSHAEFVGIEPVAVSTIAGIYPSLPSTVTIDYKDTETNEIFKDSKSVLWDDISLDSYKAAGSFTVSGTVDGLNEKASAMVTVTGNIGTGDMTKSLAPTQDAYIQYDGTTSGTAYGAKQGSMVLSNNNTSAEGIKYPFVNGTQYYSFSNNYVLKIKNALNNDGVTPTSGYNRRFLIQYNLADLGMNRAEVKNAKIKLRICRYDYSQSAGSTNLEKLNNTKRKLWIYNIGDQIWDESTITWDNAPKIVTTGENTTPAVMNGVEFSGKEIIDNNNTIELDVSQAIREATGNTINFYVAITDSTGYDDDNSGFDFLSKEGAQAYVDALKAIDPSSPAQVTDYSPSLTVSNVYETGITPVAVETPRGVAPVLPNRVTVHYSDSTSRDIAVTWNSVSKDQYSQTGQFTVYGTSSLTALPVRATVKVTAKSYSSAADIPDITVKRGKPLSTLGLPQTVRVLMDDGSSADINVIRWDGEPPYAQSNNAQEYVFTGLLDIPNGYVNPGDIVRASVKVITTPTVVSKVEITTPRPSTSFTAGDTLQLTAQITCDTPDFDGGIVWSVSPNGSGVEVDQNGLVTVTQSAAAGRYTITAASALDNTKTSDIQIKVSKKFTEKDEETGISVEAAMDVVPDNAKLHVETLHSGSMFELVSAALSSVGKDFSAWDIKLLLAGIPVQPNGSVAITLPIPDGYDTNQLALYCIADNGQKEAVPFTVDGKNVRFTTTHFSVYALVVKALDSSAPSSSENSHSSSSQDSQLSTSGNSQSSSSRSNQPSSSTGNSHGSSSSGGVKNNSTSESPRTGGENAAVAVSTLAGASLLVCLYLYRKNKKS